MSVLSLLTRDNSSHDGTINIATNDNWPFSKPSPRTCLSDQSLATGEIYSCK